MMATLHPTSLFAGKARVWYPALSFTTVEDDPDVAKASELQQQLIVSIETRAGDYEEQQITISSQLPGRTPICRSRCALSK